MTEPVSRRAFLGAAVAAPTLLTGCGLKVKPCPPSAPGPALPDCRAGYRFENWSKTLACRPASYCQPHSTEAVAELVKAAAAAGKRVRTVGAGHSFSPLVLTRDVLVNLDNMQSILTVEADEMQVTVQAGVRLKNLIRGLRELDPPLALANLGSVTEQSIAGAAATATHGTGVRFGALSTQIEHLKLVTGTGEIITIDSGERLQAARVSLGALGIATEVTLKVVPLYDLESKMYWCQFDDIIEHVDTLVRENERVLLWWLVGSLGCRQVVIVNTMNPPGHPEGFLGRFQRADKVGRGPLPRDTQAILGQRPREAQTEPACTRIREDKGRYDQILTLPLVPLLHRECEYAVPIDKTVEALRRCKRLFDARETHLLMPVEVRFVRRDDALLSPARDGDVCYIGVSTRNSETPTEIFAPFEALMRSLGGRPHWGKVYSLTAQETRALYPDSYDAFVRVRDELDPRRVFANEHIEQLFD